MHVITSNLPYSLARGSSDLKDVIEDCTRMHVIQASRHQQLDQILIPLWRLQIYRLQQLVTHRPDHQYLISWNNFLLKWPNATPSARRALHLLNVILCRSTISHIATDFTAFEDCNALQYERNILVDRQIPDVFRSTMESPGNSGVGGLAPQDGDDSPSPENRPGTTATHGRDRSRRPRATQIKPATSTTTMRSIPNWRPQLFPLCLFNLIQVDYVTAYSSTQHNNDNLQNMTLGNVHWRPTYLLSQIDKDYLITLGFRVASEAGTETRDPTQSNLNTVLRYSTVFWKPTVELLRCILQGWTYQALAYYAKSPEPWIQTGGAYIQNATQLEQGIDMHAPRQGIPDTILKRVGISITPADTNPDKDLMPTGSNRIVLDDNDRAHCFDAEGHYAGSLDLERMHYILSDLQTNTRSDLADNSDCLTRADEQQGDVTHLQNERMNCLPDAIYAVMTGKGLHRPRNKRQMMMQPIATLGSAVQHHLRLTFSTTIEWMSDPLSRNPEMENYASFDRTDSTFGALTDPYSYKWLGSGQFITSNTTAESYRALKWALMSATDTSPVLNVGVIQYSEGPTGISRLLKNKHVHVLCTIKKGSISKRHPTASVWYNENSPTPSNKCTVALIIVYNSAGYIDHLNIGRLTALKNAFRDSDIAVDQWNPNIPERTDQDTIRVESLTKAFQRASSSGVPDRLRLTHGPPTVEQLTAWRTAFQHYITVQDKRFKSPGIVFTDSSMLGQSLTGAVYRGSPYMVQQFKITTSCPSLHTVLHGELAAIHRALTIFGGTISPSEPLILMTDSLTGIYLIQQAIYTPERIRTHKHKQILTEIVHLLVSRTQPVEIYKVRAHTGVLGNEKVDKLAKEAHDLTSDDATDFSDGGSTGRPSAWITYDSTASGSPSFNTPPLERRDVTNLQSHIICIAGAHHVQHTLSTNTSSVMQKSQDLLSTDGGIDTVATRSIWTSTSVTPWMLRTAILIRLNRLWTTVRQQRCLGPDKIPTTICPRCHQEPDDADHALNKCTQPLRIQQIKSRHDHAVHSIVKGIMACSRGADFLHSDARNIDARPADLGDAPLPHSGMSRKLSEHILPLAEQTSIGDIVLIDIPPSAIIGRRRPIPRSVRQTHTIDIIEVKYVYDLQIHHVASQAINQHTQLKENLLRFGWKCVNIHPFIIGSAGTIRNNSHDVLRKCGMTDTQCRKRLLNSLASSSVIRTTALVRTRDVHLPAQMNTPPPPSETGTPNPQGDTEHEASRQEPIVLDTAEGDPEPIHCPNTTQMLPNPLCDSPQCNDPDPIGAQTCAPQPDIPPTMRRDPRKRTPSVRLQDLVSNKRPRRHTAPLLPAHAESVNHQPADTHEPSDGQACPEFVSNTQPQPVITDPGEQQRHASAESDPPGRKRKHRATVSVPAGTAIRRQQDREALPSSTIVHERCPQSNDMRHPNDATNTDKDCVLTQDTPSPSRPQRTTKRPQRYDNSATDRGRDQMPIPTEGAHRPRRQRRTPPRFDPSAQQKKRPRAATQPTLLPNSQSDPGNTSLITQELLGPTQRSGLAFDRG